MTWDWQPSYSCPFDGVGGQNLCVFCTSCKGLKYDPINGVWNVGFPTPPSQNRSLNCNQQANLPTQSQTAVLSGQYDLQTITWWLPYCSAVWSYSDNFFSVP